MDNRKQFIEYALKINALKYYQEFLETLKKKQNKEIEKTVVYKALTLLLEDNQNAFAKCIPQGQVFYRARKIKFSDNFPMPEDGFELINNKLSGFDSYNSKEPPIGIGGEGRNNVAGQSYLYLSEDEFTACIEVNPIRGEAISVAKFCLKKPIQIIDFQNNQSVSSLKEFAEMHNISAAKLITLVMQEYCTPAYKADSYLVTQYISDYIRKKRYDGIKFLSSKNSRFNLTIFNCDESIIQWESSSVFYCSAVLPELYDLNEGKRITPTAKILTQDDCDEIKNRIVKHVNNPFKN